MPEAPPSDQLLERRAERRALADALRATIQGEGRAVMIEGSAGIGKTALLQAFVAGLDSEVAVATARGSELEVDFAFGVTLQLLAPLVEQEGSPELFEGAAGLARPLFERAAIDTGRDAAFPILHGLHWLCASLAERAPLVICLDDAQWADAPSLQFISYLGARASELPILIVVARRTGEQSPADESLDSLAASSADSPLRPSELSREAVSTMAQAELGDAATAELSEECWRLSGGNPLYARELLRVSAEPGSGDRDPGAGMPESIVNLVGRRVGRLDPPARSLAKAIAILGDSPVAAEVDLVADLEHEEAMRGVDDLIAAELIEDSNPYGFRHPIMRQAVLGSIPAGERALLHMSAARASAPHDAKRAATHLIAARPDVASDEAWASAVLHEAAAEARLRGGTAEAIGYLRRALVEPSGEDERRRTLFELGTLEAQAGEGAALDHLAEAATLANEPAERAEIALVLGEALFQAVALEECSRVCREAIAELGDGRRELRLALEAGALNAESLRGVNRDRPSELAAEVSAGASAGERAVLVHVVADLGATGARPAEEVRRLALRALGGSRLLDEVGPMSPLFVFAGTALAWAGEYESALELTTDGLREARRRGSPVGVSYSAALRSGIALRCGDLRLAESDAELVVSETPGADPIAYAAALSWLLEALVERGRLDDARAALERSGLTGELPELGTIDFLMLARAGLARAEGEFEAAGEELEEVGRRVGRARYPNPAAIDWRSRLAEVMAARGDQEGAVALATEEAELARSFGATQAIGLALRRRGSIIGGAEGLADIREAGAALALTNPVEHARAVVEEGCCLHACRADNARDVLYRGMDIAHRAGAHALVETALDALRSTGARPRRPRVTGVDSLTPQERRIAQMAADGRGNREIAEALFLTRRTVEMHLSNAYRKLHIDSRDALPTALAKQS